MVLMAGATSATSPYAEQGLDWQRYLRLLQSHSVLFCTLVVSVTSLAVIASYAIPKKYEAMSSVSVEQSVISDLVKGIAITPSVEAKLRLLQEHLKSRSLLFGVASELNLDLDSRTPEAREQLVAGLRDRVAIRHDERKGVFYIAFADRNPVLARDFVNTMTRLYIEQSTAAKRRESYDATDFLNEQIQIFQKRIEQAQTAIDEFKSRRGMHLGLNEQLLRQQIKEQEQRLETFRIRKSELSAKLRLLGPIGRYSETLREKEMALQTLRVSYTEKHPTVRKVQEEIRALKIAIEQEEAKEEGAEEFSAEYQSASVELRSLEESELTVRAELQDHMRDLRELPAIRTELAELEQRKNNETRIYEQLVARFGQSEVSKQMELQDKAVTFRVIDAAVTPLWPISPIRYLFLLGGIVLSIVAAGGGIVLMDLVRMKIRSAGDLKRYEVKILAKLPRIAAPDYPKWERRRSFAIGLTLCFLLCVCVLAVLEFLRLPYMEQAIARVGEVFALAGGPLFS